jgi:hypothetical protein
MIRFGAGKTRPQEDPLRRDWIQVVGLGVVQKTVGNTCHATSTFPIRFARSFSIKWIKSSSGPSTSMLGETIDCLSTVVRRDSYRAKHAKPLGRFSTIHAIAQPYHQRQAASALRRARGSGRFCKNKHRNLVATSHT